MSGDSVVGQRLPKDRDFVETQEGMLFCVVDYLHPPGKYTAYLKYSPAETGRWHRGGTAYHRELAYYHAHQVGETLDYLARFYPEYLDYCPVRDLRFSFIPRARVGAFYRPEQRLAEILRAPADPLEQEAACLAGDLLAATGLPASSLGITGSILLGIHDPSFSDIDITIYGQAAVERVRAVLAEGGLPGARPLDGTFYDGWRREIVDHHGLTPAQVDWLISRRWNFAYYGGQRYLSLHPVRTDAEIIERYGDHYYRDAGICRLRATVCDASAAIYLPALYAVEDVRILDGPHVSIAEICSCEGLFSQAADAGQEVEAQGKLEQIDGGPMYRLVIGSSHRTGREYLVPVGV